MSLFQFRIAGRLYSGFGLLILCGLALALLGVVELGRIGTQIDVMTRQSNNAMRTSETAMHLQAIRRAILRYDFDHDEKSFTEAGERLATTASMLEAAIQAAPSEERRAAYKEIAKDVEQLKSARETLGDAVRHMTSNRARLFTEGDKMAADVQKFEDAAAKTDYDVQAAALVAKVLLVRVANWRFLATKDIKGIDTFKANLAKAMGQVADMQRLEMPADLAALLAPVRSSLSSYADAFDKTSSGLLAADEIYYKTVSPLTVSAVDGIEKIKQSEVENFLDSQAASRAIISGTTTLQEIVAGGALLLGLVIAFLIARGITGPLSGLTSGMKELADGNFGVVLPGVERKDEVGEMARAVETFKHKAEDKAREDAEAKVRQDQILAEQRKHDMHRLADGFESAVGEIIDTVSSASRELEGSAGSLTSTAERAVEVTTMVAAASEEAATNVQSVASATEQMASSVNEISRQVQESADIARQAVDQARLTNSRVSELAQAANRIGNVVELINTIAGQTNLLALNATIEAARAGDAGRGFAVVASEVKALADQTAKATGEISQQIAGMQTATSESVGAIKEIGTIIGRMSEIASTIASAVEEQGAATQEISRNVQQAAQGTTQVSANIVDVQRGADDTGAASTQVLSAARSRSRGRGPPHSEVTRVLQ
ncbi:MAG: HAMP domain-containing methyl-accepting chemotaxis protein [Xanthobacteraceae bacterium]|nr:HAMP domain-containing methyl-accepting chemotaxis protein [Xanthobacteraceae bacterium]